MIGIACAGRSTYLSRDLVQKKLAYAWQSLVFEHSKVAEFHDQVEHALTSEVSTKV